MSKYDLPKRMFVRSYLADLIEDKRTREEVSNWATQFILGDYDHVRVEDWPAWEMLSNLAAADLMDSPSSFLYQQIDFEEWLVEFDQKIGK